MAKAALSKNKAVVHLHLRGQRPLREPGHGSLHRHAGPRGCTYSDPALLALAWSTPGDGCSSFSFQAKRRSVQRYQEDCPRFSYVPTGVSQSNAMINCTEYEYQDERDMCAPDGPQPVSLCQKSSSDQLHSESERDDESSPWYNCLHM
ncbi:hemolymph clottable protein [Penaeus vannamei]|uniref:Hemolymph clottable protein n=1 Tax=Penaeus vannamei TaxID=6689 RepID=A0A423T2W0_PENVA|nr:hemolymph clottable protein [Penaeus vannamei]